ncbi:MAG: putative Ig domain-containing protein [Actinobacteria bacterium]|nr:putative Ig domain-containing protein [Actinomycetota bacterium]MBA3585430.1 putative Ig domain-containing protein [Gemmatimonadota bacterium]
MSLKRLLLTAVVALAAAVVFVPVASAGDFDPPRMGCTGDDPATCPAGQVGKPYSLSVRLVGDQDTGCAVLSVGSGSLPPGLSITQQFNETNAAIISGTPTAAGTYSFYLTVDYNAAPGCLKSSSDNQFIIQINPEVPRLVLQPEQSAVPISTIGRPFALQMTSNLADPKTWTVAAGQLPPGLSLGASDGLISGTPTTAGTYSFTVSAALSPDPLASPPRSDTKALQIVVRPAVVISASEPFVVGRAKWEVGVPFDATLEATGGNGVYTWALATGSTLPTGLALGTDGTITGRPRAAGITRFSVTATDGEGRVATYRGTLNIAAKLAIVVRPLPVGKVGKRYQARLRTTGGVAPVAWRIKTGPLPRGVRFDRMLGVLAGTPTRAGRYRITVKVTDELGAKSTKSFTIVVRAAPKR